MFVYVYMFVQCMNATRVLCTGLNQYLRFGPLPTGVVVAATRIVSRRCALSGIAADVAAAAAHHTEHLGRRGWNA